MYSLERHIPYFKIQGANMGPTWVLSAPDGPHVGPMNLAFRDYSDVAQASRWLKSQLHRLFDIQFGEADNNWPFTRRNLQVISGFPSQRASNILSVPVA